MTKEQNEGYTADDFQQCSHYYKELPSLMKGF